MLATGAGAIAWIREHTPDTNLLDLMLPGADGLAICRGVRSCSTVATRMGSAGVGGHDPIRGRKFAAPAYT